MAFMSISRTQSRVLNSKTQISTPWCARGNMFQTPISSSYSQIQPFYSLQKRGMFSQTSSFSTERRHQLHHYDVVVIGSGLAAHKAAIYASKKRPRSKVLFVKDPFIGSGTDDLDLEALRDSILYLSGYEQRSFYGTFYTPQEDFQFTEVLERIRTVREREYEQRKMEVLRYGISVLNTPVEFLDSNTLLVSESPSDQSHLNSPFNYTNTSIQRSYKIKADKIILAAALTPRHDPFIPVDGKKIVDFNQFLKLKSLPRSIIVVGAGVEGLEVASSLACLRDIDVTVIDSRTEVLRFLDKEITDDLLFHLRSRRVKFRLGDRVEKLDLTKKHDKIVAELSSGMRVIGDLLIYAGGRKCNTNWLHLERVKGLQVDDMGRVINVNEYFQTEVPNIYAIGDTIGRPALAASAVHQANAVVDFIFGEKNSPHLFVPEQVPYGIYTVPAVSMVGQTEQTLRAKGIPYEYGLASFAEMARALMSGDERSGKLKILFHRDNGQVLGVHCIGQSAAELIHIGQVAVAKGAHVRLFADTCFNYPTFAEAYQVAALDGLNKIDI